MLTKRILSTHHSSFLTNHKILTKRGWGELTKAYDECISWVAPTASKGGRGKAFILVPQKLAIGNLPVKIGTSSFGNRNIWYLKTSH
jgi:hypothetical protein